MVSAVKTLLLSIWMCGILSAEVNILEIENPPVPNSRKHAAHNADAFQRAIAISKRDGTLYIPAGRYYTHGWGPTKSNNFGYSGVRGEGRRTIIHHVEDADDGVDGCFVMQSQAAMYDAAIRDIAFSSDVNEPIVTVVGYSILLENVFIRGAGSSRFPDGTPGSNMPTGFDRQIGLTMSGQHFTLNHCQVEFCNVGMRFPQPYGVQIKNGNIEYNERGLELLNDVHFRGVGVDIAGLYSEGNSESVYAKGLAFSLRNWVGRGSVVLEDCHDSTVDLLTAERADVQFRGRTNGCLVKLPLGQGAKFTDQSSGMNSFQVGSGALLAETAKTVEQFITKRPDQQNSHYYRRDSYAGIERGNSAKVEIAFRLTEFAQVALQLYDSKSREFWDFDEQRWTSTGSSLLPIPYVSGQVNSIKYRLPRADQNRSVRASLLHLFGPGQLIEFHTPLERWVSESVEVPIR